MSCKNGLQIIFLFFLFIILPIYPVVYFKLIPFKISFALYLLTNTLILFYLFKKDSKKKYHLKLQNQDQQEKLNLLTLENTHSLKTKSALKERIRRYNSLKEIIEEINKSLDLESLANRLTSIAFSLISNNRGSCILYLVDIQTQNLAIFKTKKEDRKTIIKAKQGDIFDLWVLRHAQPLFIEDVKKDFRFDLEKLKTQDIRPISSLISSPLISDHRFLGILRLDNSLPAFYSQDDIRFLVTISDLGAVALENAQLFQRTQDLAIHDGLTSLYTKGYFLARLKEEYRRCVRNNANFSLLMLDIDYFKNYNDKFGHTAGDIVLKNLSLTMLGSLKGLSSLVGRFGGEEFCIILSHTDKKNACSLAEELRIKIQNSKVVLRKQETNVTVSIGVATLPFDARDEDELIFKADKAMYEAKQKGRNRVACA